MYINFGDKQLIIEWWVKEGIKKETKLSWKLNKNKSLTQQNSWDTIKALLWEEIYRSKVPTLKNQKEHK